MAAQFLRCRRRSSLVTAVRFSDGQNPFLLNTAAQNIHVFLRKSPLCRNHFFWWLKAAVLLFDCGTSTLKSPPSRAFSMHHVHPRLRKHLSRCTLDCGFKTSESPALRGFEAERGPIRGTSLYLVLLSNGPHRSKIQLIKFGFSPINTPANIAKKLPLQCCTKPLLIPFFNFSHKWPTFAFTGESGYTHSAFGEGSHTAAYTPKQGAFQMGVVSLPSERSTRFGNPARPGGRTANFAAFGSWLGVLSKNAESLRDSDAFMRVAVPKASRPRWVA